MYKEIEKHYDGKTTYVFKKDGRTYALNGCTVFNLNNTDAIDFVMEEYGVSYSAIQALKILAQIIADDITDDEIMMIFNSVGHNQWYMNDIYDYGVEDLFEYIKSNMHLMCSLLVAGHRYLLEYIVQHKEFKESFNLRHYVCRNILMNKIYITEVKHFDEEHLTLDMLNGVVGGKNNATTRDCLRVNMNKIVYVIRESGTIENPANITYWITKILCKFLREGNITLKGVLTLFSPSTSLPNITYDMLTDEERNDIIISTVRDCIALRSRIDFNHELVTTAKQIIDDKIEGWYNPLELNFLYEEILSGAETIIKEQNNLLESIQQFRKDK